MSKRWLVMLTATMLLLGASAAWGAGASSKPRGPVVTARISPRVAIQPAYVHVFLEITPPTPGFYCPELTVEAGNFKEVRESDCAPWEEWVEVASEESRRVLRIAWHSPVPVAPGTELTFVLRQDGKSFRKQVVLLGPAR